MFPFFSYFNFFFFFLALFLSRPCFTVTARIIPESVTVITTSQKHNATSHNFSSFLHAERGSHVSGMAELKKYFHRFGYLTQSNTTANSNFTDKFDSNFESAVLLYQKQLGLQLTGKLDSETISTIESPRCGVSDTAMRRIHTSRHFAYFNGKPRWLRGSPMTLSYAFSPYDMIDTLSLSEIRTVFERSFKRWASVIPVSFRETEKYQSADIRIGFYFGDHGDGEPFDGVLGVLAHAFSPQNGRFHLDAAENWAVDFDHDDSRIAVDLESVVTHEIGHVLGLGHSSIKEAVMYPNISPRKKKVDLKIDDVEGVQSLYGSNPNFSLSALLQSENSYNLAVRLKTGFPKWIFSLALTLFILFLSA